VEQYLTILENGVSTFGIWFVIAFLFVENIPVVGLFAPGLTVLVLSGFFHETLTNSPITLFFIAWLTIFVADTLWYLLGRFGSQHSPWLQSLAKRSPNVEEIVTKQPLAILLCYQFMVYFRMFLPFSLGIYRFSLPKWLIVCCFASGLYTSVFFGIGFTAAIVGERLGLLDNMVENINTMLVLLAFIYGGYLVYRYQNTIKKT